MKNYETFIYSNLNQFSGGHSLRHLLTILYDPEQR